jgi:hypothetical protein
MTCPSYPLAAEPLVPLYEIVPPWLMLISRIIWNPTEARRAVRDLRITDAPPTVGAAALLDLLVARARAGRLYQPLELLADLRAQNPLLVCMADRAIVLPDVARNAAGSWSKVLAAVRAGAIRVEANDRREPWEVHLDNAVRPRRAS